MAHYSYYGRSVARWPGRAPPLLLFSRLLFGFLFFFVMRSHYFFHIFFLRSLCFSLSSVFFPFSPSFSFPFLLAVRSPFRFPFSLSAFLFFYSLMTKHRHHQHHIHRSHHPYYQKYSVSAQRQHTRPWSHASTQRPQSLMQCKPASAFRGKQG